MRSKARWLLLLVVIPVLVLGAVVAVGRGLLDGDGPASTVALTGPAPSQTGEPSASEDAGASADDEKDDAADAESSASSTSRVEAQRSEPSATKSSARKASRSSGKTSFQSQVVKLTNRERAKAGCKALKSNTALKTAAQKHSADMAKKDYFSHTGKDGRSPFDRMTDAGYAFSAAAENIAAGQRTPADVVKGWMNSAGHKANIINCTYTEIGVGYAKGGSYGTYWTQDFGKPA